MAIGAAGGDPSPSLSLSLSPSLFFPFAIDLHRHKLERVQLPADRVSKVLFSHLDAPRGALFFEKSCQFIRGLEASTLLQGHKG